MNFAETEFDGLIIEDYRLREISIGAHTLEGFQFRWLLIKGIHAAFPIWGTLFSIHLK